VVSDFAAEMDNFKALRRSFGLAPKASECVRRFMVRCTIFLTAAVQHETPVLSQRMAWTRFSIVVPRPLCQESPPWPPLKT
jgi:hypothetical protein